MKQNVFNEVPKIILLKKVTPGAHLGITLWSHHLIRRNKLTKALISILGHYTKV